jgi:VWFA-related protein
MRTQLIGALLLAFLAAGQQQPQQSQQPPAAKKQAMPTFKASANLVIVNVTVRDKSGKLIENLKADDFEMREDDKPQKISVFEFQRLEKDVLPPPEPPPPLPATNPAAAFIQKMQITPSLPGQIRFRDRRLMVLLFDFSSMQPDDQIRAQKAAEKFLDEQMTVSDAVSIMSVGNTVQVLQDFTTDRETLHKIIRGFRIGEGSDLAADASTDDEENEEDTGAAFTADETEFNIFNTDRKLSALESAVKMLQSLPEKKALVYFSSGISRTGVENQSQLRATVNAAVRSNVAFYPIDARGLVAEAPGGNASVGSPRGTGMFTGTAQTHRRDQFHNQQETLVTLAEDTGGKAMLDNNDLSMGIVQAQGDIGSYYILGYYSSNSALDGRFRRIRVRMVSNTSAKLDYRSGYYASKEWKNFSAADKEQQLSEALLLGDPLTDLPLALETNYFRLARDRYFVPVAVKIPGSEIELIRKRGAQAAEFDFIGQVRDSHGRTVSSVRDGIQVKLGQETASQLGRRNLQYDTAFTLPPGEYLLKFLARENTLGKMGTFETKFTVPDLYAETTSLRTSSVVWANQREALANAVGTVERNKKLLASHPLIQEGQKLIPSITRVFRRNQDLYVYFEVYDAAAGAADKAPNLVANLRFYRGKVKAFQSEAVQVTQTIASRKQAAAVELRVPLEKLTPGRYTCQVNVVDQNGQKFAFPRAPLVLLP